MTSGIVECPMAGCHAPIQRAKDGTLEEGLAFHLETVHSYGEGPARSVARAAVNGPRR